MLGRRNSAFSEKPTTERCDLRFKLCPTKVTLCCRPVGEGLCCPPAPVHWYALASIADSDNECIRHAAHSGPGPACPIHLMHVRCDLRNSNWNSPQKRGQRRTDSLSCSVMKQFAGWQRFAFRGRLLKIRWARRVGQTQVVGRANFVDL